MARLSEFAIPLMKERWSAVLAYALLFGEGSAARAFRVSDRSVQGWKAKLKTDADLRALVESKRGEFERARLPRPALPARDDAAEMTRAVAAAISKVAAACGLPPVLSIARLRTLPSESAPDFVLTHAAPERHTVCFVLPRAGGSQDEVEQRLVGRLFFFLEGVRHFVRTAALRRVVLADCAPSPVFRLALLRVGAECFDVSACLLPSQNVLTAEGVAA
jgi:hypothetical protein